MRELSDYDIMWLFKMSALLWNVLILLSWFYMTACLVPYVYSIHYPFQNTSLPFNERVSDLIGRLTVEEIVLQMSKAGSGKFGGPAPGIPRLNISKQQWNAECLHGDVQAGNATSFPQAIGMAASFKYVNMESGQIKKYLCFRFPDRP